MAVWYPLPRDLDDDSTHVLLYIYSAVSVHTQINIHTYARVLICVPAERPIVPPAPTTPVLHSPLVLLLTESISQAVNSEQI